jgi:Dynamitin
MSNPTPTMTVDPADEAGGEVIYSSDGLAPVQVTKPPSVAQTTVPSDGDELVLDSETMPPQTAFEVFKGKVYSVALSSGKSTASTASTTESPLEKLSRLQSEVAALEQELQTTAADSGRAFDEQVVQLATDLKTRLANASTTKVAEQDELTRMIRQQLQNLQQNKVGSRTKDSIDIPSSGVVYELYGNASGNPTTSLEERLLKLERLLGNPQSQYLMSSKGTPGTGSGSKTLLNRLEDMEALIATVDATTLEQTAIKAKVIRADLEAASKARNKLTATYKKEDSKMIQQLHQQMVDLEGLSGYLPNLVDRLQQLSTLHRQSATFGSRLEELERGATQVEATVGQLEVGMTKLQETMVQNITTMEANLQKLDAKLK